MAFIKSLVYLISFLLLSINSISQSIHYSTANAHSHNDYEQSVPFYKAFQHRFGSIEADIHLVEGKLLVGHDSINLKAENTLENLYLNQINSLIDSIYDLQLLIDIKTEAIKTLDVLQKQLIKYPKIIHSPKIKIVISGNRPEPNQYNNYPDFIWFDGRLEENYTSNELSKIALLSQSFTKLSDNNLTLPISKSVRNRIEIAVKQAHKWNKKARLWANPDNPAGWEAMIKIEVDYINTDHIEQLADFLK